MEIVPGAAVLTMSARRIRLNFETARLILYDAIHIIMALWIMSRMIVVFMRGFGFVLTIAGTEVGRYGLCYE